MRVDWSKCCKNTRTKRWEHLRRRIMGSQTKRWSIKRWMEGFVSRRLRQQQLLQLLPKHFWKNLVNIVYRCQRTVLKLCESSVYTWQSSMSEFGWEGILDDWTPNRWLIKQTNHQLELDILLRQCPHELGRILVVDIVLKVCAWMNWDQRGLDGIFRRSAAYRLLIRAQAEMRHSGMAAHPPSDPSARRPRFPPRPCTVPRRWHLKKEEEVEGSGIFWQMIVETDKMIVISDYDKMNGSLNVKMFWLPTIELEVWHRGNAGHALECPVHGPIPLDHAGGDEAAVGLGKNFETYFINS